MILHEKHGLILRSSRWLMKVKENLKLILQCSYEDLMKEINVIPDFKWL